MESTMSMRKRLNRMNQPRTCSGFTLVEVLLAVMFLTIMVTGISTLYFSGQRSLHAEDNLSLVDSHLRGRMEEILGRSFDAVSDGSEVVTINGQSHTVTWTAALTDMDGDAVPESNAKQVTVSIAGQSLTTIVVDNEGRVGKI
jgi:Tfp pilus assembly protein PilV